MLLKNEIIKFYNSEQCYQNINVCGPNRTKLKNGKYFPPPYPYIGENYELPSLQGKKLPRIFFLAMNQNLSEEENISEEKARWSLYPTNFEKLEGHWYGPLDLCVSLANIAFSIKLGNAEEIPDKEIMKNIAYNNCVRCANTKFKRGAPTEEMVQNCKKFTENEIKILKPDFIFCIGRKPYWQIREMYNTNAEDIIVDFVFKIKEEDKEIKVLYFYHYGIQQSINAGKKLITLFAAFNNKSAKQIIKDVEQEISKFPSKVWRENDYKYNDFAKYYSIKIIEKYVKESNYV